MSTTRRPAAVNDPLAAHKQRLRADASAEAGALLGLMEMGIEWPESTREIVGNCLKIAWASGYAAAMDDRSQPRAQGEMK